MIRMLTGELVTFGMSKNRRFGLRCYEKLACHLFRDLNPKIGYFWQARRSEYLPVIGKLVIFTVKEMP